MITFVTYFNFFCIVRAQISKNYPYYKEDIVLSELKGQRSLENDKFQQLPKSLLQPERDSGLQVLNWGARVETGRFLLLLKL